MKNDDFYDLVNREISELSSFFEKNDHYKKQDENGKKSFLFLFWFLKQYLPNIEISEYEKLVTEGNDDSSCDIFFKNSDQSNNEIYYIVQAKWFTKTNINKPKGITKEIKACIADFNLILSSKKESEYNKNFNENYKKFIEYKKSNGKIKFIFLCLCSMDNKDEYLEHISNFNKPPLVTLELIDFQTLKQNYIETHYKGARTHNPIEIPYIPKANFDLEFIEKQSIHIEKPYEAYIFLIKPKQIYEMFEKYGQSLFYKNIRNPLPNSLFNKEISSTILNNPIHFWYYNNGITAITEEIGSFHEDSTNVTIKGIQIINGAQTVFSIFETYRDADEYTRDRIDNNALITNRITTSGGEDFDLKVTRYTNSQNPISERDFHSNDEIQKKLQNDFFKNTNIWYETRRGEFRKKPTGVIKLTNEILGQNYLAYYLNDPFNAKQNKKKIFMSNNNSDGFYENIFNNKTKYDDMLLAYYLNLLVDRKRKQIKNKIDKIDTTKVSKEEKSLLDYDFIQYSNFEIMALFKIAFEKANSNNPKSINGKAIFCFENNKQDQIDELYEYIIKFICEYINILKNIDSKIVNSVLFKNKEFYPKLKKAFIDKINEDEKIKYFKFK